LIYIVLLMIFNVAVFMEYLLRSAYTGVLS